MAQPVAVAQLHIGTSGWSYRDWRGVVYPADLPARRWFAYYAERFDTVEINTTFYRQPSPETFRAWRRQAPPGFVYAVKANRFITHMKKLRDPEEPLARFFEGARELGPHLGPVLYQLPPSWGCDLGRLRAFIDALPPGVRHVFEFREPSWRVDDVRALLTERGMGSCIHDLRGHAWLSWVTGPFAYVRFHGPSEKKYHGSYGESPLRRWADRIGELRSAGLDVYAYFNNDDHGHAVANARRLRELVAGPPAAWAG